MSPDSVRKNIAGLPIKSGVVLAIGILCLGWLLNTPAGLMGKADAVGYAVCHRIETRSFLINGRPLPLCARCSGMYLGAMAGLSYLAFFRSRQGGLPGKGVKILMGVFVLGFAVDGLNSFLSLIPGAPVIYTPQNWSRLLTGSGMGLVIAAFLFPAFNQTVWRNWNPLPALDRPRFVAGFVLLAIVVDLLMLTESPWILYPFALISAAGVVVILTLVYSMLWLMLLRKENSYDKIKQLSFALAGGFGTAMLQIAVFDLIRFLLTGTWDGFHLG
jgi:uncharacterized membrane protein